MAEYENREANYNNGLGKVIGSFAMGCVQADNLAKDAYVQRQIMMMGEDPPNVDFVAKTNLIGLAQPLETRVSVPKIILAPSTPLMIEKAFLSMDMSVSASTEDNLAIKSDTEAEGSVKAGWGPISGELRIKSALSVAKDQKRSSDYTSTTHAELTMVQGPAPEGLMKIIDSLNATTARALDLNSILIEDQAEQLRIETGTAAPLPAPAAAKTSSAKSAAKK